MAQGSRRSPRIINPFLLPYFPPPLEKYWNLGFRQIWTSYQKLGHESPPPPDL